VGNDVPSTTRSHPRRKQKADASTHEIDRTKAAHVKVDTKRARKIADDPGDTDGYEMCQMITALADEVDRLRENAEYQRLLVAARNHRCDGAINCVICEAVAACEEQDPKGLQGKRKRRKLNTPRFGGIRHEKAMSTSG